MLVIWIVEGKKEVKLFKGSDLQLVAKLGYAGFNRVMDGFTDHVVVNDKTGGQSVMQELWCGMWRLDELNGCLDIVDIRPRG